MSDRLDETAIDRELQEAGARWRALQPPPGHARWRQTQPRPLRAAGFAAFAALVGVLVAIVGWNGLNRPDGAPAGVQSSTVPATATDGPQTIVNRPTAQPTAVSSYFDVPLVLRDGDTVKATGIVSGEPPVLCAVGPILPEAPPSCQTLLSVRLEKLDPTRLPGWSLHQGAWISSTVTVTGTWHAGAITVESFEVAHVDDIVGQRNEVPCLPPPGGWEPPDESPPGLEAAAARLTEAVVGDPNRYSGLWVADADPSLPTGTSPRVLVVGTVDDVDEVRAELTRAYTHNLCVVTAQFSRSALDQVAVELATADPAWQVSVDVARDRVAVKVIAYDETAASVLNPFMDKVRIESLVTAR